MLGCWLRRLVSFWMVVVGVIAGIVGTTTAGAAAFTYDFPTIALVGTHAFEDAKTGPAHLSTAQEASASPTVEIQAASTTPVPSVVATNTAMATVDDLSGSALSNYNRFVKNLPAAAETPTITNLADGALEFSAKVPATNILGSYATYTKIVGPDGVTTSFIKTTIAPDGSVVSVKVKYP
jgi:hypothetical protein